MNAPGTTVGLLADCWDSAETAGPPPVGTRTGTRPKHRQDSSAERSRPSLSEANDSKRHTRRTNLAYSDAVPDGTRPPARSGTPATERRRTDGGRRGVTWPLSQRDDYSAR